MTEVPVDALRQRAARVAARAEVSDVRLFNSNANFLAVPGDGEELSYRLDSDVSAQYIDEDGGLIVTGDYYVDVRSTAVDEDGNLAEWDDRSEVVTIELTMAALFQVLREPDDEPFEEDEVESFARTTGHFALHPYARELVADLTGRMGLPQLHIGMMKLRLDAHKVQGGHRALHAPEVGPPG